MFSLLLSDRQCGTRCKPFSSASLLLGILAFVAFKFIGLFPLMLLRFSCPRPDRLYTGGNSVSRRWAALVPVFSAARFLDSPVP